MYATCHYLFQSEKYIMVVLYTITNFKAYMAGWELTVKLWLYVLSVKENVDAMSDNEILAKSVKDLCKSMLTKTPKYSTNFHIKMNDS